MPFIADKGRSGSSVFVTQTTPVPMPEIAAYNYHANLAMNPSHQISQEYQSSIEVTNIGGDPVSRVAAYITDWWTVRTLGDHKVKAKRIPLTGFKPFEFMLHVETTLATAASIPAGAFTQITTFLEDSVARRLCYGDPSAKNASVGFFARSNVTGMYALSIMNKDRTRSYVYPFPIHTPNEIQWVPLLSLPPDVHPDYASSWQLGPSTIGWRVQINLCSGADFNAVPYTWHTGEFYGGLEQVNLCSVVGNYFDITGLVILPGDWLPDAEHAHLFDKPRHIALQEARLLTRTSHHGDAVINEASGGVSLGGLGSIWAAEKNAANAIVKWVPFDPPLLTPKTPLPVVFVRLIDTAGNMDRVSVGDGAGVLTTNQSGFTLSALSDTGFLVTMPGNVEFIRFHYIAYCRL